MKPFCLLLSFVCFFCYLGNSFAEDAQSVLSAAKLQELVMDSRTPWLVLYSPTAPDMAGLDQLEGKLSQFNVHVGAVDCSQKEHKKTCQALGPQIPSIQFYAEAPAINPYTKKNYRKSVPFSGSAGTVDGSSIERFVSKNYPNNVNKVADLQQLETSLNGASVILFSDKDVISTLYKSIALELGNKFQFLQVGKSAADILEKYSINSFPAFVEIESDKVNHYQPSDKADLKSRSAIVQWLSSLDIAAKPSTSGEGSESASEGKTKSSDNASSRSKVSRAQRLDATFTVESIPTDESWLVLVHNQENSAGAQDWEKTSRWCEGKIRCAELACNSVDTASATALVQALCSDFADGNYFHFVVPYGTASSSRKKLIASSNIEAAAYSSKLSAFKFGLAQSDQARRSAADSLPDHVVRYVDSDVSLQNFLNDANSQGLITAVVVSDKETPPTFLRNLALSVAKVAKIGFMHGASQGLSKMIGQISAPTMVCFFSAPSSATEIPAGQLQVGVYDANVFGPMKLSSLAHFVSYVYQQSGYRETNPIEEDAAAVKRDQDLGSVSGSVQSSVLAIRSTIDWESHCSEKFKGICAIALGSGESGSEVLSSVLQLMGPAAAAFKFLSADGNCFQNFASAFEVDQPQIPTVVAFSPSKLRFATYRGAFTAANAREFLDSVISGKTKSLPMSQRPVLSLGADGSACDVPASESSEGAAAVEDSEDMSDFLAEIRREEEERAQQRKKELEEEAKRAKEEAKAKEASEKSKGGKKSKGKKSKGKKSTKADEL